jgi:hypothetical protein
MENIKLHHIYTLELGPLTITVDGVSKTLTNVILNGRSSYVIVQDLIAQHLGLLNNSEGSDSDLKSKNGIKFEAKKIPQGKKDLFHTAPSCMFGNNSSVNTFKKKLTNSYNEALEFCKEKGYNKNDYYIYHWNTLTQLNFIVVPKDFVIANLDKHDPRLISTKIILESGNNNANQ